MTLKQITSALLTCVAIALQAVKADPAHAIKQSKWKAICDVGNDASKLATYALNNVKAPATLAKADVTKLLRALVYNTGNSTETSTTATKTATAFLGRQVEEDLAYYQGPEVAEDVTSARNGGRLEGAINEFISVHADATAGNKGCLSGNDNGGNPVESYTTLTTKHSNCKMSWSTVPQQTGDITKITAAGLAAPFSDKVEHGDLTAGDKACDINSVPANFKLNDGQTGVNVNGHRPKMAGGLLTIEATNGLVGVPHAASASSDDHPYIKHAALGVKRGRRAGPTADTTTVKGALQSASFMQAARRHILGKDENDDSADNQLEGKVKAVFKTDDGISKLIDTNINDMPISGILKNSPNLKKLGDVTDINQLLELYFHYSDLNKQRLQEAAKKLQDLETKAGTKSATDKEKECNTKGNDKQEECKN
uniref:Variant surface glycoprotein 1125.1299 n=1 Tax=Trypanosoma brucei TaxID=5691 RepID=A0A1J0R6M9_9TRYP|nr:variant surface glycoprotein 1125.1299 [Trypanosoma brucei]